MTADFGKPAIVLVRPQLGANIGMTARAMLNFGLTDLRLVAPRDGWPNPDAGPAAAGADSVLAGARVFATVQAAIADCGYVYATTVRPRDLWKPTVTAAAAANDMTARPVRQAVLFGAERAGLETEEVAIAHAILTVPVNPAFGSLNLSQAVLLVAYEIFRTTDTTAPVMGGQGGPADHAELEQLYQQFDSALDAAGYYNVPSRIRAAKRTLRNLLTRPAYSSDEVRTWRGIAHALITGRRGQRRL